MPEPDHPPYERLTRAHPRSGFSVALASRSSLWLGPDHLLCIETTGFTETYKRFYFRDIQALILRQTKRQRNWSLVFGVLTLAFSIIAMAPRDALVAWIFGPVAALFLLALILNLTAGPTCTCQLRTAVQTEELPSLNRLRRARRVLARLKPLIEQAQGSLAPEELSQRLQEWTAANTPAAPAPAPTPAAVVDDPNAPPRIVPG